MTYQYLTYGIPLVSTIELPAFVPVTETSKIKPISVSQGLVPDKLQNEPLETKPFSIFNEHEFLYTMPDIARYYVRNGEEIIIEAHCDNWQDILIYFYSNCMAAALLQRNMLPFHVSGIFIEENKVLLFAAPSRTGKSTTSVILQQKGYKPFTDDTALMMVENGQCYAYASYPMIRLWQNTIKEQNLLDESSKKVLRSNIELKKYGFLFHEQFVTEKVQVAGIVFLEEQGAEIKIERLNHQAAIEVLSNNVYRKQWVNGMKKQLLQFKSLSGIAHVVPAWKATRPKLIPTFQSFADTIEEQIITAVSTKQSVEK